jgi:hypothetical protein
MDQFLIQHFVEDALSMADLKCGDNRQNYWALLTKSPMLPS